MMHGLWAIGSILLGFAGVCVLMALDRAYPPAMAETPWFVEVARITGYLILAVAICSLMGCIGHEFGLN